MTRFFPLAIVFSLVLLAGAEDKKKKGGHAPPTGYAWEANYEQAKLKAASEGKLLFIDFWKDG